MRKGALIGLPALICAILQGTAHSDSFCRTIAVTLLV